MAFRMTLMHPPLDDPTLPYHSNAYLAGHLRHNGFEDVSIRDVNIEYINYCFESDTIDRLYREVDERLASLRRRPHLSYQDQEQYYRLSAAPRLSAEELHDDIRLFRNRAAFLEYPAYVRSMRRLNGYFGLLGSLSYPGEIENFMLKSRGRFSPYSLSDLLSADLAEKLCFPFVEYFHERLRRDPDFTDADLFGISVVYDHQLIHALHLARMLKRTWPEKRVVFGGTAMSQLYKYLKDKQRIKAFFKLCDAIVIGEGETAICEIADCKGEFSAGANVTNTITYDRYRDVLTIPQVRYEDLTKLGAPKYDHKWDLYFSPERGINYSPTRGCYWNRCTFCDYGLNTDKPTSPWRERRIDQVIEDLREAQRAFGVKYVYLAVDVLAPAYMDRLSDAIIQSGLDIRWSAEIRLEKVFNQDRANKIAQSGAVCLSFGMESGNQRVLDLIDKGTKVAYMGETMKNFASAGVAVQLMAFTGFPTETPEEEHETRQFVRDHADYWSAGGLGQFLLTGTSIIARNPEQFGITIIETKDADIARAITYTGGDGGEKKSSLTEDADASFDDSAAEFPSILGRPWAGGTDTLHSMIYYETYGRNCFKQFTLDSIDAASTPASADEWLECTVALDGRLAVSNVDLTKIFANRQLLVDYLKERLEHPAEPTYSSFIEWESRVPAVAAETTGETYWLVSLTSAVKLGKLVYQLLQVADAKKLKLRDLLGGFSGDVGRKLLDHFHDIARQGLLSFVPPGGVASTKYAAAAPDAIAESVDSRVVARTASERTPLIQLTRAGAGTTCGAH